jgi:hypothetical protein
MLQIFVCSSFSLRFRISHNHISPTYEILGQFTCLSAIPIISQVGKVCSCALVPMKYLSAAEFGFQLNSANISGSSLN